MIFTFIAFINLNFNVQAEYRVYQYYVFNHVNALNDTPPKLETSTLDPISYVSYHGGYDSIHVNLLRSWKCKGNTALSDICFIGNENDLNPNKNN